MKMNKNCLIIASTFILFNCKENYKVQDPELISIIRKNTLIIKGSDTEFSMVQDFCKSFKIDYPQISIKLTGGGSGYGIEALINNEIDIANSSRKIKDEEIERARKNGVNPLQIMFSVDALAIITNSKLGVDSLSTDQLTQIFSGETTNWKLVGGPNLPIVIYSRDKQSGTQSYIRDKFVKTKKMPHTNEMKGNAEIVAAVKNNLGAIGYVGVGFLMDENKKPNGNIWAMPIYIKGSKAYSPYEVEAVKKGEYVLTRPLYQYIHAKPNTVIYNFIMSELTKKGKEIIESHGYFPITDYQNEINNLNGL